MSSFNLDYLIHAANILLLTAYSVRNILWLRFLAVASSLAAMPYFLLQPTPLWAAFGWSVLFTGINIFQASRLLLERRPVKLTAEEEEVRRLAFRELAPRKVLELLSIASWETSAPGERLIEQGMPVESVSLIVRGKVRMISSGHIVGELGAGEFVGSALLLTGALSEVDGTTAEPTRTVRWDVDTLERYLQANPETRNLFQEHLVHDLAGKLQRLGAEVSEKTSLRPVAPSADKVP
jgi:hypothetical protein